MAMFAHRCLSLARHSLLLSAVGFQAKVTTPSSGKAPNQEPLICRTVRCRKLWVLCELVFFTVAFFSFHFLSTLLTLLRLLASPSLSWAVRVHWRPSSWASHQTHAFYRTLQSSILALCHQMHHFFLTQTWASASCHCLFTLRLDPFRDSCGAV